MRDRYVGLRDFAPAACLTLDAWGTIHDINHEGAELLGSEQSALIREPLIGFAEPEIRPLLLSYLPELRKCDRLLKTVFSISSSNDRTSVVRARGHADPASRLRFIALMEVADTLPGE